MPAELCRRRGREVDRWVWPTPASDDARRSESGTGPGSVEEGRCSSCTARPAWQCSVSSEPKEWAAVVGGRQAVLSGLWRVRRAGQGGAGGGKCAPAGTGRALWRPTLNTRLGSAPGRTPCSTARARCAPSGCAAGCRGTPRTPRPAAARRARGGQGPGACCIGPWALRTAAWLHEEPARGVGEAPGQCGLLMHWGCKQRVHGHPPPSLRLGTVPSTLQPVDHFKAAGVGQLGMWAGTRRVHALRNSPQGALGALGDVLRRGETDQEHRGAQE